MPPIVGHRTLVRRADLLARAQMQLAEQLVGERRANEELRRLLDLAPPPRSSRRVHPLVALVAAIAGALLGLLAWPDAETPPLTAARTPPALVRLMPGKPTEPRAVKPLPVPALCDGRADHSQ